MAASANFRLNSGMGFGAALLWRLGWQPRRLYLLGGIVAIIAASLLRSPGGLLFGAIFLIVRWKATAEINGAWRGFVGQAEGFVKKEGASRVGVDPETAQCHTIAIGKGAAPFGIQAKPEYTISAVYICETFLAIYPGTSFTLRTFELRFASTGEEIYFRHVSAVNYHDRSIEIVLTRGKTIKQIAVASEADAAPVLEALRAKLRMPSPGTRIVAPTKVPLSDYVDRGVSPQTDRNVDQEPRYCYLRASKLKEYYSDPAVLAALLEQLEVPGKVSTLKQLTEREKQETIETQIEHFRESQTSVWCGVPTNEVLAASIWRAQFDVLGRRLVRDKFYAVSREEDLARPIAKWLKAREHEPYMEVPLGRRRIDVLGYKKAGIMGSPRLAAVELKNSDEQFGRGIDQMGTFGEYANVVYLACLDREPAKWFVRVSKREKRSCGKCSISRRAEEPSLLKNREITECHFLQPLELRRTVGRKIRQESDGLTGDFGRLRHVYLDCQDRFPPPGKARSPFKPSTTSTTDSRSGGEAIRRAVLGSVRMLEMPFTRHRRASWRLS